MIIQKTIQKELLRPITTGANNAINQSEFLEISCNLLKARGKRRVQDEIGFGSACHLLKSGREKFHAYQ